jgi:phosphate acetyltransferase
MSSFIDNVLAKAKANPRTIVLPEGGDERVLEAANTIASNKYANIVLLGKPAQIEKHFNDKGYDLSQIKVIDPETAPEAEKYAETLCELRKAKGMTIEKAREVVKQFNYFATMMVKMGDADGLVSGAVQSTADTVRPALQIVKSAIKGESASAFFVIVNKGVPFIFSDCGLVEDPSEEGLATIAKQSAKTALSLGVPAKVAMLSYSTYGSASSHLVDKVVNATKIAKETFATEFAGQDVVIDGELQFDAATVPSVAEKKCPESPLKGDAKVLIFPDLNAGNISYKLAQRMGDSEAYGPILQGLNAPINDLSRGCSADDIVGVVGITVLQSLENK